MKRFIKNILFFFLPVLLFCSILAPFYLAAFNCGEFKDIEENIEVQRNNHDILIGLGYNEQTTYYKLVNANYYQANVIALGTSRVMLFKNAYFTRSFYNCGGAVGGNYSEYINFLKNLTYKPEVILLGLDQWVFNDAWNRSCKDYTRFKKIEKDNRNKGSMLKDIARDWTRKKWSFADLKIYPENIGFNGRIKGSGFMYDGSYYYGDVYRNPQKQEDYQFKDTFSRIEEGKYRFEWGERIDNDTLDQLKNLLDYCSEKKIYVIGILPPFAPAVYSKIEQSGNYNYFNGILPACQELFLIYGFEVYDYSNGSCIKVTDDSFIDGFHGSEVVYCKIIQDMIKKSSIISNYVDLKKMNALLNNAYDGKTFLSPDRRNK